MPPIVYVRRTALLPPSLWTRIGLSVLIAELCSILVGTISVYGIRFATCWRYGFAAESRRTAGAERSGVLSAGAAAMVPW